MIVRRNKLFSIQSGKPDKRGTLGSEVYHKLYYLVPATLANLFINLRTAQSTLEAKFFGYFYAGVFTLAIGLAIMRVGTKNKKKWAENLTIDKLIDSIFYKNNFIGRNFGYYSEIRKSVWDKDPKKYTCSIAYDRGNLAILLNKPNEELLEDLNELLEGAMKLNKDGNYVSIKDKSGYIVLVDTPDIEVLTKIFNGILRYVDEDCDEPVNIITKFPKDIDINKLMKK